MPPTDTPLATVVSPARLLGGVALFALVLALALLAAWLRRVQARRASPVVEATPPPVPSRGYLFAGDDEDDDAPPVHVPLLVGRPVVRRAVARSEDRPSRAVPRGGESARAASRSALAERVAVAVGAAAAVAERRADEPLVHWSDASATVGDQPEGASERGAGGGDEPEAPSIDLEGTGVRRGRGAPPPLPPADPALEAEPAATPPTRGDILLVEDEPTIASMYTLLLGGRGYATRHAGDGLEALAMLREGLPALILLDMRMPRMDGLRFLRILRGWSFAADVPVVILSNVGDRPMVEKAMALGALEYLVKAQTRPQVLLGALPHWLRGNRALTTLS
jgi:CheY-like chemotaxis protein